MLIQPVSFAEQLFTERTRRKVFSALVAATGKRAPAALRPHSRTETVDLALCAFLGLIGSLHNKTPFRLLAVFITLTIIQHTRLLVQRLFIKICKFVKRC